MRRGARRRAGGSEGRECRRSGHLVGQELLHGRALGGHTLSAFQPEKLVRLDGTAPAKVGDPIAICVDTDVVKDVSRGLEIHGALRGTYCGER